MPHNMNKPKLSTFLPVLTALGLIAPQCGYGQVTVWNLSWKPLVVQEVKTYSGSRSGSYTISTTMQPSSDVVVGLYDAGLHQSISFMVNGYRLYSLSSSNMPVMNGPDQIAAGFDGSVWTGLPSLTCSFITGGGGTLTLGNITPADPEPRDTRANDNKCGDCSTLPPRPPGSGVAGYRRLSPALKAKVTEILFMRSSGWPDEIRRRGEAGGLGGLPARG